jgi:N-acetylglucosamine-6-phosphate deacetylase
MGRAIENGCRLVTHLYSCTSTITRDHGYRSLGVIESAFLRDELYVELIADGSHLPKELVQMIVKIKGADKVALITDSLHIAGTETKEGIMGGTAFIVEDGVCKLRDRSAFAGSVATADKLLQFAVLNCGFDMATAVSMLTAVPAEILRLPKGKIEAGLDADLTVFDDDFQVSDVFVSGIHREV